MRAGDAVGDARNRSALHRPMHPPVGVAWTLQMRTQRLLALWPTYTHDLMRSHHSSGVGIMTGREKRHLERHLSSPPKPCQNRKLEGSAVRRARVLRRVPRSGRRAGAARARPRATARGAEKATTIETGGGGRDGIMDGMGGSCQSAVLGTGASKASCRVSAWQTSQKKTQISMLIIGLFGPLLRTHV